MLSVSLNANSNEFSDDELDQIASIVSNYDICTNEVNLLEQKTSNLKTDIWYYRIGSGTLMVLLVLALIL
jgi:hypothetical protein